MTTISMMVDHLIEEENAKILFAENVALSIVLLPSLSSLSCGNMWKQITDSAWGGFFVILETC